MARRLTEQEMRIIKQKVIDLMIVEYDKEMSNLFELGDILVCHINFELEIYTGIMFGNDEPKDGEIRCLTIQTIDKRE